MHFILNKPVYSDHLSYLTTVQYSLERSHNAGLTVYCLRLIIFYDISNNSFIMENHLWGIRLFKLMNLSYNTRKKKKTFPVLFLMNLYLRLIIIFCFVRNKNLTTSLWVRVRIFNATFNTIAVISWRSVLLVEETGVPGENHWPTTSHWQTLSQNVTSTPPHERDSNSQL